MNAETRRKLRELAEKASPDPWKNESGAIYDGCGYQIASVETRNEMVAGNAAFIAALHPGVVIEMLDAMDRAEERIQDLSARNPQAHWMPSEDGLSYRNPAPDAAAPSMPTGKIVTVNR